MTKNLAVVVSGTGEIRDVAMPPGTTVGEMLAGAGLEGYRLSMAGGNGFLKDNDNLYEKVKDGEKVYASPFTEAGS